MHFMAIALTVFSEHMFRGPRIKFGVKKKGRGKFFWDAAIIAGELSVLRLLFLLSTFLVEKKEVSPRLKKEKKGFK